MSSHWDVAFDVNVERKTCDELFILIRVVRQSSRPGNRDETKSETDELANRELVAQALTSRP